ncbi:MAG: hypothetical protein ABSC21_15410 [Terriglobia bacterium]|jgi:hypothetical protein
MNPPRLPNVPGNTSWERLDQAFRTVLTVPKEKLLKEEAKQKLLNQKKRAKRPA